MTQIDQSTVKYATFTQRMLASVIDTLLSSVLLIPLANIFNTFFKIDNDGAITDASIVAKMTSEEAMAALAAAIPSFIFQSLIMAIIVVIFWIYKGATPGKIILRMKIVDAKTGEQPTKAQSIIRYLGYFVSLLPLCFGFVWIYYDKKKQGFHDKLADTVVVKY